MKDFSDNWAEKAKKLGYRSRASFKLDQIENKYKIISRSDLIFELGSAPGGWSQIISKHMKKESKCFSFDLLSMSEVKNISFFQKDITSSEFNSLAKNYFNEVDLVLSDMSVNLSGISIKDEEENKELNYSTINLSKKLLKKRGNLLIKTFNNRNLPEIKSLFKGLFNKVIVERGACPPVLIIIDLNFLSTCSSTNLVKRPPFSIAIIYEKFGEKHLFLADSWKLGFHAIRKLSNGSFERRAFIY